MEKSALKAFVANDNIDELFEILHQLSAGAGDRSLENDIIMQSAKWQNLQRQRTQGVLDNESLRVMRAQLDDALLYIIDKLPEKALAAHAPTHKPTAATQGSAAQVIAAQPLSPGKYMAVSAVSLVLAIVLFVLLAYFQDGLSASLGDRAYYLLLFPLAFSAAAFLFGAMRTYAAYSHKENNQTLELGGPIVAAALVIAGGFFLVPGSEPFEFTIHLVNAAKRPEFDAKFPALVKLRLDNTILEATVDKDGAADFKGIPANFEGKEVALELSFKGWQCADTHHPVSKIKLKGKSADLTIERDGSLSKAFGAIRDNDDNLLAGVVVSIGQLTTTTDSLGRFEIQIPESQQQRIQQLKAVKKGFEIWEGEVIPENQEPIEILLKAKR